MKNKIIILFCLMLFVLPVFADTTVPPDTTATDLTAYERTIIADLTTIRNNQDALKSEMESMKTDIKANDDASFGVFAAQLTTLLTEKTNLIRLDFPLMLLMAGFFLMILALIGVLKFADYLKNVVNMRNIKCLCGSYAKEVSPSLYKCAHCGQEWYKRDRASKPLSIEELEKIKQEQLKELKEGV